MHCLKCHAPDRKLWPPVEGVPEFRCVDVGEWISLASCLECEALWTVVPWEPYASFPYWVVWPTVATEWRLLHDIDAGRALHEWHESEVRRLVKSLANVELAAVEAHHLRSRGRSPLDRPDSGRRVELDEILAIAKEHARERA